MSQCDHASLSDVLVPEIRNESEDFRRDLVDCDEPVPLGSNQTEDLQSIPFESINLRCDTCKHLSTHLVSWPLLTSSWPGVVAML